MINKFGQRLNELLEDKKISQKALSKEIGVSDTCVSFWISGKRQPTAENICLIAKFFNTSSDYLLGLTDF